MAGDAMLAAVSVPTGGREFYTPELLASELSTTPGALAMRRTRGGGPPFVRVGRRVVYPVVGVRIWALQHMTTQGGAR